MFRSGGAAFIAAARAGNGSRPNALRRVFAITGFSELGEGRLDAVYVAEARDGGLCPAGQARFFVSRGLWHVLDERRAGPAKNGIVPVWLGLVADIKFFGRHKGGSIHGGVILSLQLAKP